MSIPIAPVAFEGPLEQLYDKYVQHVLPEPGIVEQFHKKLIAYLAEKDPLFLTRKVGRQKRSDDDRIICGSRVRPTDNSPAWWIHYQLFNCNIEPFNDVAEAIDSIPCEMFNVKLPQTANTAGWHTAPIYDVKDENTDSLNWSTDDLVWRAMRNLHPCNYFYIPKTDWKRHAGQAEVLSFFQAKYANRYASVWEEFLQLAQATPYERIIDARSYAFATSARTKNANKLIFNGVACTVSYEHPQLSFNAKWIEPLEMNQRFCVVTPNLYFIMTKKQFYDAFPSVVKPGSCYRNTGVHHFRSLPLRARPFMIERNKT